MTPVRHFPIFALFRFGNSDLIFSRGGNVDNVSVLIRNHDTEVIAISQYYS